MSMTTRKTLYAGQPGTKKWIEKFGQELICVRYKYDTKRKIKLKTVELIAEEKPWKTDKKKIHPNKTVLLRVEYGEIHIGRLVRAAGGRWNRDKKLWELPYREATELGLTDRIVG